MAKNAYQMMIRVVLRSSVMLLFSMMMAFQFRVKLSLIFLAAIPVLGISLYMITTLVHPVFERVFQTYDKQNHEPRGKSARHLFGGLRVILSMLWYCSAATEEKKWRNALFFLTKKWICDTII